MLFMHESRKTRPFLDVEIIGQKKAIRVSRSIQDQRSVMGNATQDGARLQHACPGLAKCDLSGRDHGLSYANCQKAYGRPLGQRCGNRKGRS